MNGVVFVTNAGPSIGGGHLSRCHALASAFEEEGIVCRWILNHEAIDLADNLGLSGVNYIRDPFDASCFSALERTVERQDLVVIDTYRADSDFYERLQTAALGRIMTILDSPCSYAEDVSSFVLDYNLDALGRTYGISTHPRSLYMIGSSYALMRKEIRDAAIHDGDKTVLIPGAFDVAGAALDAAIWYRPSWGELILICGPFVSDAYERQICEAAHCNVTVLRAPKDLPQIMADAKHIICTASVTMHEALALHKKTSVFAAVAGQLDGARFLGRTRAGYDLGMWSEVTPERLELAMMFEPDIEMLDRLVDIHGASRCAREILSRWNVLDEI